MLKNIFLKTLFERRVAILSWNVGIFITILGVGTMFPSVREMLGNQMAQIPKEFQGWFGGSDNLMSTFTGYTATELVGNVGIMLIIMAIIFGASFLSGDETQNILQPLLTLPISRSKVYLQKWLALVVINFLSVLTWSITVVISAIIINETISIAILSRISLVFFFTNLTLATLSFALGAIFGKHSIGGIIVGVYAFLGYFINALSAQSKIVENLNYLSIFKYSNYISLANSTIKLLNLLIIITVMIFALAIGLYIFKRRDIRMS